MSLHTGTSLQVQFYRFKQNGHQQGGGSMRITLSQGSQHPDQLREVAEGYLRPLGVLSLMPLQRNQI